MVKHEKDMETLVIYRQYQDRSTIRHLIISGTLYLWLISIIMFQMTNTNVHNISEKPYCTSHRFWWHLVFVFFWPWFWPIWGLSLVVFHTMTVCSSKPNHMWIPFLYNIINNSSYIAYHLFFRQGILQSREIKFS